MSCDVTSRFFPEDGLLAAIPSPVKSSLWKDVPSIGTIHRRRNRDAKLPAPPLERTWATCNARQSLPCSNWRKWFCCPYLLLEAPHWREARGMNLPTMVAPEGALPWDSSRGRTAPLHLHPSYTSADTTIAVFHHFFLLRVSCRDLGTRRREVGWRQMTFMAGLNAAVFDQGCGWSDPVHNFNSTTVWCSEHPFQKLAMTQDGSGGHFLFT